MNTATQQAPETLSRYDLRKKRNEECRRYDAIARTYNGSALQLAVLAQISDRVDLLDEQIDAGDNEFMRKHGAVDNRNYNECESCGRDYNDHACSCR